MAQALVGMEGNMVAARWCHGFLSREVMGTHQGRDGKYRGTHGTFSLRL